MRVAKLRVGILRVEMRASMRLVSYFRTTRSLPSANALAHSKNFLTGNNKTLHTFTHNTCVYV